MERQVIYCIKNLDNAIFRRMFKGLKDFPYRFFNPVQGEIVKTLFHSKDKEIYQKDIEKLIGIRRSTISGILKTMEKNGIIVRIDSLEDKRIKKIVLTDKAISIHNEVASRLKDINNDMIKGISDEELDIFFRVTDRIRQNIEG